MLRSVWRLDATASEEVLKGTALRARARQIRWLRHSVQILVAAIVCWIGVAFIGWVRAMERGDLTASRPAGVEGFLRGARVFGIWNSRVTNAEYSERIRDRDLPQYQHVR